jgi:hypothetical protein
MCAVVRLRALMARQAARLITYPPIEQPKLVMTAPSKDCPTRIYVLQYRRSYRLLGHIINTEGSDLNGFKKTTQKNTYFDLAT